MSYHLGYPRCYASNSWYSLPQVCGGSELSKSTQHYVKYNQGGEVGVITGWIGDLAMTEAAWEGGDPASPVVLPAPQPEGPGLIDRLAEGVNRFFDTSDKASGAATVGGYAVIALIGAGLLIWYKPRGR